MTARKTPPPSLFRSTGTKQASFLHQNTKFEDSYTSQNHDEIMEVLEGRILIYVNGKELVLSAGDPNILIPRGHIHGFTFSMYTLHPVFDIIWEGKSGGANGKKSKERKHALKNGPPLLGFSRPSSFRIYFRTKWGCQGFCARYVFFMTGILILRCREGGRALTTW
jgi:hypothetical protein